MQHDKIDLACDYFSRDCCQRQSFAAVSTRVVFRSAGGQFIVRIPRSFEPLHYVFSLSGAGASVTTGNGRARRSPARSLPTNCRTATVSSASLKIHGPVARSLARAASQLQSRFYSRRRRHAVRQSVRTRLTDWRCTVAKSEGGESQKSPVGVVRIAEEHSFASQLVASRPWRPEGSQREVS